MSERFWRAILRSELLSTILKDSTGAELSDYVKSLNLAKVAGIALTGRDWSSDLAKLQNLDVALSVLAALQRWGRNVAPAWVEGSETTAPAAGTALVSRSVSTGKTGYVYGIHISTPEANEFKLGTFDGTTFTVKKRLATAAAGVILIVSGKELIEGVAAGLSIQVRNVNAGSAGKVYQASLLYAEA